MGLIPIYSSISSTSKSLKPLLNSSIQPKTSWMQKMQSLPRKGWKLSKWKQISPAILNRVLIQRRPGQEKRRIETTGRRVRLQERVSTTHPWMIHLIKYLCKSRMTSPWSGQKRWREIPISAIKTNIAASIEIMGMTQMSAMIWNSK